MNGNVEATFRAEQRASRIAPRPTPKPPRWSIVPCRNSHCIYRGTIHPESYHTAKDGTKFDRPA